MVTGMRIAVIGCLSLVAACAPRSRTPVLGVPKDASRTTEHVPHADAGKIVLRSAGIPPRRRPTLVPRTASELVDVEWNATSSVRTDGAAPTGGTVRVREVLSITERPSAAGTMRFEKTVLAGSRDVDGRMEPLTILEGLKKVSEKGTGGEWLSSQWLVPPASNGAAVAAASSYFAEPLAPVMPNAELGKGAEWDGTVSFVDIERSFDFSVDMNVRIVEQDADETTLRFTGFMTIPPAHIRARDGRRTPVFRGAGRLEGLQVVRTDGLCMLSETSRWMTLDLEEADGRMTTLTTRVIDQRTVRPH